MRLPLLLLVAAAGSIGVTPARAAEREVTIGEGATALHGSLLTPDKAAAGPAVLLIAGSGPTDRNGDSMLAGVRPGTLRLIAQGLAAQGVASLRFDKRGIAASAAAGPSESALRFTTYVDDAVAWTRFLAARPGVAGVVIAGHSEGALIAAMAARRTTVSGVVEIAGAGRKAGAVIRDQLAGKLPPDLAVKAEAALSELEAGRPVADPPLPALFRPSVQSYLISWLPIDPAAELAAVHAPVLILQGEADIQVSVADARALAAARPGARLVLLPGVNHVLKDAPPDPAANAATYADPALPLGAGVLAALVAFVKQAGGGH